jgi:hypothetical protein
MADISSLGEMKPVEVLDLDIYNDAKGFRMPPKGEYTLQAPESFTFGRTGAGALSATIDSKIADGDFENIKIRFQKVSAKVFKRGNVNASQLGDYLRACGFRGKITNEQEQADAVEATANRLYKAKLDWRAYCNVDGFSVEGMERFPSDGNGGHLPVYFHPTLKDPEDATKPLKLRAQLVVPMNGYIAATE